MENSESIGSHPKQLKRIVLPHEIEGRPGEKVRVYERSSGVGDIRPLDKKNGWLKTSGLHLYSVMPTTTEPFIGDYYIATEKERPDEEVNKQLSKEDRPKVDILLEEHRHLILFHLAKTTIPNSGNQRRIMQVALIKGSKDLWKRIKSAIADLMGEKNLLDDSIPIAFDEGPRMFSASRVIAQSDGKICQSTLSIMGPEEEYKSGFVRLETSYSERRDNEESRREREREYRRQRNRREARGW
jgi:hypothetical protein